MKILSLRTVVLPNQLIIKMMNKLSVRYTSMDDEEGEKDVAQGTWSNSRELDDVDDKSFKSDIPLAGPWGQLRNN